MFAKHDIILGHAHRFRRHYLVTKRIAKDTVLVDPGLMCKCVTSDNRLIRLDAKAYHRGKKFACRIKFGGVDAVHECHLVGPYRTCHHDLFERSIAGSFTDAVDSAFHLACTSLDRREAVRDRETEIVVTVNTYRDVPVAHNPLLNSLDKISVFVGKGITDRVRDVQDRSSFGHGCGEDLAKKFNIASGGILS